MRRWLLLLFLLALLPQDGVASHTADNSVPCLPMHVWPPHIAYGTVPTSVSTRATHWVAYTCELATGYVTKAWLVQTPDLSMLNDYASGLLDWTRAQKQCISRCWQTLTDTEWAFVQQQAAAVAPKAVVAFNAGALTRSTYHMNPDGSLNVTKVGEVTVGAPCSETQRIRFTSYYLVRFTNNVAEYAVCVVSIPYGTN
jgi:hypothetical protein